MKSERWKNNSSSPNNLFSTYLIEDRCRRSFHNITFKIVVTLPIKLTLFRMFTINIKITIFIQLAGLKAFLNICKRCYFHLYWIQLAKFFSENLKQIYLDMMVFYTFFKKMQSYRAVISRTCANFRIICFKSTNDLT